MTSSFAALVALGCTTRSFSGGTRTKQQGDSDLSTHAEPRRPDSGGLEPDFELKLTAAPTRDVTTLVRLRGTKGFSLKIRHDLIMSSFILISMVDGGAELAISEVRNASTKSLGMLRLKEGASSLRVSTVGAQVALSTDGSEATSFTTSLETIGHTILGTSRSAGSVRAVALPQANAREPKRAMDWLPSNSQRCDDACERSGWLPVVAGIDLSGATPVPQLICRTAVDAGEQFGMRAGTQAMSGDSACIAVTGASIGSMDCLCSEPAP